MKRDDWYYTATVSWTHEALDAQSNRHFNGFERVADYLGSEDEARRALVPHLLRAEISHGFIFCQRDVRRGEVEVKWRKSVDKPGHADTPLQAMVRSATVSADGTDRMTIGEERR